VGSWQRRSEVRQIIYCKYKDANAGSFVNKIKNKLIIFGEEISSDSTDLHASLSIVHGENPVDQGENQ